jgi:DNA-binding transcriptional regulator YhcF (GntR family)
MAEPRELIVDVLRGRVLRGLQAGTLRAGDRLPSARELAVEFGVDYRLVLVAYRDLTVEGLVELRPRGGVYVSRRPDGQQGMPPLPAAWLAEVLTQGLAREIPASELHEWLRRCTETLRLRAVVVASTIDQVYGLCRELRDDFGFESEGLLASEAGGDPAPLPLRRADVIVTTAAHALSLGELAAALRKTLIVIDVRPELLGGEWALLLRRPVYVVVATAEFGEMLRRFFAEVPGIENLHVLVLGRDDLGQIPEDAPTYVTQRVRAQVGSTPIRGRLLPAARTIAAESARALFGFIVRENIEAMSRPRR